MNNRYIRIIILLLVSAGLMVSTIACGNQETDNPQSGREPVNIKVLGASSTGVMYMVLSGVSECVNKSFPGSTISIVPGNLVANVNRIDVHDGDAGITNDIMAAAAMEGVNPYQEKLDNIAAVAKLYDNGFQIAVSKDLGITSLEEIIKNKMQVTLAVDKLVSSPGMAIQRIFAEYGITVEDFEAWGGRFVFYNMSDAAAMLADGSIDGFCIVGAYPTPQIQEVAANKDLVILDIAPEISERLAEKHGYSKVVIPKGTYDFQEKDCETLSSGVVMIVPKDSPDEIAYKLAMSINENLDYLKSVHVVFGDLTLERMSTGTGIPLHPGAEKFYNEQKK